MIVVALHTKKTVRYVLQTKKSSRGSVGTQHVIELNGRRYDALTGKMLPLHETPAQKAAPRHSPSHSIDGFTKVKSHAPRRVASTVTPHHSVQKSQTLMRKAVKKPAAIQPLHGRANLHKPNATHHVKHAADIATSQYTPPAERVNRAVHTKQSTLINRFGAEMGTMMQSQQAAPAPVQQPAPAPVAAPEAPSHIEAAVAHAAPKLKKAPVHHRVAHKMRIKPRTLSVSAAVFAFMLLGSFYAYNNAANLSMRVAAMKSDVRGSLPAYKPAGFAISGPIKYQPGEIVVAYKSNSDDRHFEITQKTSNWDTDALRENYVAPMKTAYQTVQEKGKTIYLYDDSSATWVDGGVWYKIDGTSQLNTDQVLKIADSL